MKKGATLTSGILTIVLFTILTFVSIFQIGAVFEITALQDLLMNYEELGAIMRFIVGMFITFPMSYVARLIGEFDGELVLQIFTSVFAVFNLFMIFWGIKEILISRKSDESFARCKKTCGFMMFTKFMFFAFLAASLILYFVEEKYSFAWKLIVETMNSAANSDVTNICIIGVGILVLYALIIFLLPTINFAVASKKFKASGLYSSNNYDYQNSSENGYNNGGEQTYASQSTMQANMPPIPGYQPQYNTQPQPVAPQPQQNLVNTQPAQQPIAEPQPASQPQQAVTQPQPQVQPQAPVNNGPQPIYATSEPQPSVQAQFNPQVQAEEAQRASGITPGQNGVPLNITAKGIEGLERLERLRAGGMLTEENYQAMRQKIFNTDIT